MKTFIAFLFLIIGPLAFIGCGKDDEDKDNNNRICVQYDTYGRCIQYGQGNNLYNQTAYGRYSGYIQTNEANFKDFLKAVRIWAPFGCDDMLSLTMSLNGNGQYNGGGTVSFQNSCISHSFQVTVYNTNGSLQLREPTGSYGYFRMDVTPNNLTQPEVTVNLYYKSKLIASGPIQNMGGYNQYNNGGYNPYNTGNSGYNPYNTGNSGYNPYNTGNSGYNPYNNNNNNTYCPRGRDQWGQCL